MQALFLEQMNRNLLFILFLLLLGGYQVFGQCSCNPQVFFIDNDGDGFSAHWYTQDIQNAQDEFNRTFVKKKDG